MNPETDHPEWMNDEAQDELTNGKGDGKDE
jgi:hypothetical protein